MWRWNNGILIVQLQSIPKSSNNSSLGKGYILTLQGDDNWLLPRVTNISLFLRVHIQAVNTFSLTKRERASGLFTWNSLSKFVDFLPFLILDQGGELTSARFEKYLVAKGRQSYNCPAQWTLFWWAIRISNSRRWSLTKLIPAFLHNVGTSLASTHASLMRWCILHLAILI